MKTKVKFVLTSDARGLAPRNFKTNNSLFETEVDGDEKVKVVDVLRSELGKRFPNNLEHNESFLTGLTEKISDYHYLEAGGDRFCAFRFTVFHDFVEVSAWRELIRNLLSLFLHQLPYRCRSNTVQCVFDKGVPFGKSSGRLEKRKSAK